LFFILVCSVGLIERGPVCAEQTEVDAHLAVSSKAAASKLPTGAHEDETPPQDASVERKIIPPATNLGASPTIIQGKVTTKDPKLLTPEDPSSKRAAKSLATRLFGLLGRFHILVIHFPIALLFAAALGELWSTWQRDPIPAPSVRFTVLLGAVSAVAAVILGWIHASHIYGADPEQPVALHRWIGTTAGAVVVIGAILSEMDSRRGVRRLPCRLMILLSAALVGMAGHFGGILVHGDGFFSP
jgi:uncharacterized membrane protein